MLGHSPLASAPLAGSLAQADPAASLVFRGAGYIRVSGAGSMSPDYSTRYEGDAPVAGDLVIWLLNASTTSANTFESPAGWARSVAAECAIFSKIVDAGDLASPPVFMNTLASAMQCSWIAYDVTGYSAPTHGTFTAEVSVTLGPSNQSISAAAVNAPLIAISHGAGSTGTSMAWSGATADKDLAQADITGSAVDVELMAKFYATGTGDDITVSKADNGGSNSLSSVYITLTDDTAPSGITGTLDATEAGADVAAFAGTVLVNGTLAATETGADSASISGAVLVSGALAATEAGNDNAAFTGSVLVSGDLDAIETGADVAAFTGTVEQPGITGTMDATETGSDIALFRGPVTVQQGGGGGSAPARKRRRIDIPADAYAAQRAKREAVVRKIKAQRGLITPDDEAPETAEVVDTTVIPAAPRIRASDLAQAEVGRIGDLVAERRRQQEARRARAAQLAETVAKQEAIRAKAERLVAEDMAAEAEARRLRRQDEAVLALLLIAA